MVLGWKAGENPVINGILDKKASLESTVKLLESENKALKSEISTLRSGVPCTEWRDMLIGKKKMSDNQAKF
jgi:cell division protein FtsB